VAEALGADKVDAFLLEPATATLVALGVSDTPMGRRQQEIGLDRLPLANGGRSTQVFANGEPFCDGAVDQDAEELRGIREGLGVRSQLVCPLDVGGERRGVLQAMAADAEVFTERDLRFLGAVARWVGMVAYRAELVERRTREAVELGRAAAADELLALLTPRQREVVALVAAGLTNEEIGTRLVITPGSAAHHVERILARLGARRRTQIASWIGQGLPSTPPDGHA
jgi:DNA-binding CsgD family transcriptional regulator